MLWELPSICLSLLKTFAFRNCLMISFRWTIKHLLDIGPKTGFDLFLPNFHTFSSTSVRTWAINQLALGFGVRNCFKKNRTLYLSIFIIPTKYVFAWLLTSWAAVLPDNTSASNWIGTEDSGFLLLLSSKWGEEGLSRGVHGTGGGGGSLWTGWMPKVSALERTWQKSR